MKRIGNYKAGPGRPPGRKNHKTLAMEAAVAGTVDMLEPYKGECSVFLSKWVRSSHGC